VRHRETPPSEWKAFTRFPEWMWRNEEMQEFVEWLRSHNVSRPLEERVSFHGLDLYSLYTSIGAVLRYLDEIDPEAARVARQRYGCLTPWESDPATYGRMALAGRYRECEREVAAMLTDLLRKRMEYSERDGERFADAMHNARVVANAERYYRVMYYGSAESWNLRERHMFETLSELLRARGPQGKAVVWEHNSHIGDARATEMSARGELNGGQLCREAYGGEAYLVGFGTDHGTVAAADDWDGPMKVKEVRPAHAESYERECHESAVASRCRRTRSCIGNFSCRVSSAPSASSTGRRPSSRAITSRPFFRGSSTSTAGSTARMPCVRSIRCACAACRKPIRSAFRVGVAADRLPQGPCARGGRTRIRHVAGIQGVSGRPAADGRCSESGCPAPRRAQGRHSCRCLLRRAQRQGTRRSAEEERVVRHVGAPLRTALTAGPNLINGLPWRRAVVAARLPFCPF
jgi:erythromycin esterase-like protein